MTAPMAVPTSGVWLSWQPRDAAVGASQGGYEVRVATTAAAATSGKAAWDSGHKDGSTPSASYAGPALKNSTRYWWTVRTYYAGHAGPWATPAQFQTALGSTWAARPVWSAPVKGKTSGWAFLRGTLTVEKRPVIGATVYATALSTAPARQYVFRLSVNGRVLGDGPAPPPSPGSATYYQAWNVTSYLREGSKDTFGALAYTTKDQAFDLEVIIEYQGGVRQAWGTGSSGWQAMDGGSVYPAAGSAGTVYYAVPVEDLDAEKYPFGFDTPSFNAKGWTAPVVKPAITGLTPLPTPNPALAEHHPVKVTKLAGTGNYLLDFGTTQVGGMLLDLTGTSGRTVTLEYGEVLASPDSVQYKLSTGNVYKDVFTLKAGTQTLQYWGYRVFRYVEVLNTPQAMTTRNSQDLALVYPDQPSLSSLTTSSAALDEVWQFCKNSIDALNLDPYVDSPARERGVYEGDNYIHQLGQAAVEGDSADAGYSMLVALTAMAGKNPDRPITEYEQLVPVAALDLWWQTGDPSQLAALYPDLQKMLLPIGANGLVSMPTVTVPGYPTTLVDWTPNERDNFVFTTTNTVVNAFAYAAYHAMAQIAAELGKGAQAAQYAADASTIKSGIQDDLYDRSTGAFYDGLPSLTTHESMLTSVYVVAMGAASPAQEQTATAFIARHGITAPTTTADRACSVYCAAYFLEALYDGGQSQAALNQLTSDTQTSWLHMISLGAGSTMEAWDPSIKGNLSYSHPWASSPAFIVPNDLFGIAPLTPGWGSILIDPQPGNLTSGTMLMPTARGQVRESFTQSSGSFTIKVGIPDAATAEVALPGVTPGQQVLLDGTPVTTTALTPDSPLAATGNATLAVVQVGSGDHTITTP